MNNSGSIQVGVVGAGANSRLHHIPKLQAMDGVRVVGVCNRTRQSGNAVAHEFGIPQVYPTWEDMVADDALDAIVIGTWPNLHCAITTAALDHGKHVLCEARMAMNADEAHRMLAVARSHPDRVAQVVPSPFTLKFDRTLRKLVDEQALGRILAVDIHAATGGFPDPDSLMTWRQDEALSGMNTLTLGIWYEAMARWVGHATRVSARARVFVRQRRDADGHLRDMQIPDHVDVSAELENGAQLHLRASAVTGACPEPWSAILYGEDGTLMLDLSQDRLLIVRPGGEGRQLVPIPPQDAQVWRVEEEFVGAIRGEESIRLTPFDEGVRYMEFTEAVIRSSREGREIALPLG